MKGNGKMVNLMEKGKKHLKMVTYMKENSKMDLNMEKAFLHGIME